MSKGSSLIQQHSAFVLQQKDIFASISRRQRHTCTNLPFKHKQYFYDYR